jgi:hypothetical protein
MPAETLDLVFDLGETENQIFIIQDDEFGPPSDLTGYAAALEIIDRVGGAKTVLDTVNGGISLGGASGEINIELSHAAYIALPAGEYAWRILMTQSGETFALLRGKWTIRG